MAGKSLLEVCPDCRTTPPDTIQFHSLVSGKTAEAYVHLVVRSGGVSVAVQLKPDAARAVVVNGLECAAASEMDSGIYQFMAAQGAEPSEAAALVHAAREYREGMKLDPDAARASS